MREEERWSLKEIETASGVKDGTLRSRMKHLGIKSNPDGYTLSEVKAMIKKPPIHRTRFNQRKADLLKRQLLNDGAL